MLAENKLFKRRQSRRKRNQNTHYSPPKFSIINGVSCEKIMKKLNVTIFCQAIYNSSIQVPDEYTLEQALEYAKKHINEIPVASDLEYIADSDILDEENCDFA